MASFSIDAQLSPCVSIALVFRCLIINEILTILIDVLMLLRYSVFKVLMLPAWQVNGDGEIRTHDPLLARQVLSQLSYTPIRFLRNEELRMQLWA